MRPFGCFDLEERRSFTGNPYDGHTLAATLDQATSVSGVAGRADLRRPGLSRP
jgi:hypothetical protein